MKIFWNNPKAADHMYILYFKIEISQKLFHFNKTLIQKCIREEKSMNIGNKHMS